MAFAVIDESLRSDNLNERQKDNLKVKKLRWVLGLKEIKNVTEEEAFAANKPRYSYRSKQK